MKLLASILLFLLWSTDTALSQDDCFQQGHHNAIRLVGPVRGTNEGAVEICLGSFFGWTYFTADGWTDTEASVACRQLGLPHTAATAVSIRLPSGESTIREQANCNGDESQLKLCLPNSRNLEDRRNVAGVICRCFEGALRLVDGANHREGRVEVCVDGRWGTVCGEDWTEEEARLICGRLGLPTINATIQEFSRNTRPGYSLQCNQSTCTALSSSCISNSDVGVRCLGFDEACAVTVEEQQSATTQPTTIATVNTDPVTETKANPTSGLGAVTGVLAAALLAVVVGWIVSCVYWNREMIANSTNTAPATTTNEAYGIPTDKDDVNDEVYEFPSNSATTTNEAYGIPTDKDDVNDEVYEFPSNSATTTNEAYGIPTDKDDVNDEVYEFPNISATTTNEAYGITEDSHITTTNEAYGVTEDSSHANITTNEAYGIKDII